MIDFKSHCNLGNTLLKKFASGSFLAFGMSGSRSPGISLASEKFSSLYFTKK